MAKKSNYYRIRETFTYPGTGRVYVENELDSLTDWHPDDIQAALDSLIEITDSPVTTPALSLSNGSQLGEEIKLAEGTSTEITEI